MFSMSDIVERLREFMNNEARSCSMDFGCVTPEYVYRSFGGSIPLEEIENAMLEAKRSFFADKMSLTRRMPLKL